MPTPAARPSPPPRLPTPAPPPAAVSPRQGDASPSGLAERCALRTGVPEDSLGTTAIPLPCEGGTKIAFKPLLVDGFGDEGHSPGYRRVSAALPAPPPAQPCPPQREGGGHEAAAVYKKTPGRARRDHRAASAAGGARHRTDSDTMAQSVWGYDSDNGERGSGVSLGLKCPGGAQRAAPGLGVIAPLRAGVWLGGVGDLPLRFHPGPERWHENYPMAKGDKQSPIEINSKDVRHDSSLAPWHASYDPGAAKTILNNGRTCRVVFDDSFDRSGQLLFWLLGVVRS